MAGISTRSCYCLSFAIDLEVTQQSTIIEATLPAVVQWDDLSVCVKMAEQWDRWIPITNIGKRNQVFRKVLEMTAKNNTAYAALFKETSSSGRLTTVTMCYVYVCHQLFNNLVTICN